eukprot:CAMPEP_0183702920 /NCGR_PEP_ID=MMETSP0737-20130205/861_1 /TAXON_ID=385413 /ORGANISM="Thalassiosira miniscula, Strain CCMP1093" /LENGTH=197 /DNA_ID=CAMNT_0025929603 /DNA_START=9 /DNA_END=599 /DNA_ORIENTATION=-
MASLREVSKKDSPEAKGDIEAPSSTNNAPRITPPGVAPSGHRGVKNPVIVAKIILRKVINLLTIVELDITRPGGIITLLKDIIIGIICAIMTVSALIILDHRNIFHFESAHYLRDAAFDLFNDPETIASLEESTNFKVMTISEYDAILEEINSVPEELEKNTAFLERSTEEDQKELEAARSEVQRLKSHPLIQLDKW